MPERAPGVAIVGMAALFPGAPDLDAYRANLHAGVDAIGTVPPGRWDPVFLDASAEGALDRFYGDRGGFVDAHARFDPLAFGVVPSTVDEAEPDQLLILKLAAEATHDAGYDVLDLPRETTGVFVGRGGYTTAGLARSAQRVREGEQVLSVLRQVLPHLPEADLQRVKQAYAEAAGDLAPDQAIGLVPNLAASRTANRLDLRGPAFTFDAACASALVAVDHAVQELRHGRLDAALVAGAHLCHDVTFWSIFCRLGAMSRKGSIRPFDAHADGLLIGEGVGVVLLKRLDDALAAGDRIHAVIRGTGVASDGRGATLMSPSSSGQVLAVRRAWADAGLDPRDVGLIEAHGTATAAGDEAELRTLREVFGTDGAPVALGSVKSMIGHAMPAAGIAGLIKAAIAVEDAAWLPTLHVDTPHPLLAGTRFEASSEDRPWPEGPRLAGVNAFGFGGIDAHVVLSDAPAHTVRRPAAAPPVALYAAPSPEALAEAVQADARGTAGAHRLALREPTPDRRAKAAKLATRGKTQHGRQGIWTTGEALAPAGKVAFLCPGIEAAFDEGVLAVAEALDLSLPDVLREPPAGLDDLGLRGAQVLGSARVLADALARLGVRPDVVTGHSVGEWSALVLADVIPSDQIDGFVASLSDETLELPDVVFGALGVGVERANELLAAHPDVVLSHDNCPHQAIVCGPEGPVRQIVEEAKRLSDVLPFKSGFHTEHFAPFVDGFRPHVARLPLGAAQLPVWSATTAAPWPDDAEGVRALLLDHLVSPVRFRETVERLYEAGVRVFVQLGAGSLPGFVADTLRGKPHLAISTSDPRKPGLAALTEAAAALAVEGVSVDARRLHALRTGAGMSLRLGAPLVQLDDPPTLDAGSAPADVPDLPPGPLGDALRASLGAVASASREITAALGTPRPAVPTGPREQVTTRHLSVETDPYLLDHCMFHQPDDWPDPVDRYPVVPMTMNIQMMVDAAAELVPHRTVVGLRTVRAWRWLRVAPPVDITLRARWDGGDEVTVEIPGYAEAVVLLGEGYAPAPAPSPLDLENARPSEVPIERIYPDRWMFHGPAYQGMTAVGPIADDGIVGEVEALQAPGATLDNVGQVIGFWGFARLPVDSLGFPARIERITFHGPMPTPGTRLGVHAWLREVKPASFQGDLEVLDGDRVWCRIDGWQNRRFETDDVVLPLLRLPSTHGLAEPGPDGTWQVRERWRTTAARDLLVRRYLDAASRDLYEAVPPWEQRGWILRRVAAADAIRGWWWSQERGPLFPIQVQVDEQPDGTFLARGPFPERVHAAVTTHDGVATVTLTVDAPQETP